MTETTYDSSPNQLSEEYIQDCFHSYLKSSLTQAKAERLLDTDVLASAEADLMITGPALCLYFAALRSTTNPPSVPLPRIDKTNSSPTDLSLSNCPAAFRPFLIVWSQSVPNIQALIPEHQHDLARIICGLAPVAQPLNPRLNGIAADLRAVAIEISMRRTFQDRYANDLQAALDAGNPGSSLRVKASFVPPPTYDAPSSPPASAQTPSFPSYNPIPPPSPSHSSYSTASPIPPVVPPRSSTAGSVPPSPTPSSPGRSILTQESPAIEFIRETLYAALADVLERLPALRRMLRRDPTRAYFASVAFAILDVAMYSTYHEHNEPVIRGVLGQPLRLSMCPPELRPFMAELCAIGEKVKEIDEEDSVMSVQAMQEGKELPPPRMDRVRDILEGGVGHAYNRQRSRSPQPRGNGDARRSGDGRRSAEYDPLDTRSTDPRRRTTSTENRAVAFANRINALALGMTRLRAFRERQEGVFKVLAGVGGM
ncbi:hypothetical protein BXZ70DRAFT_449224 [Cristinia sonorae]|uniref:Uncharacterized protein n=1 Tax=Cristinia sonorae TaxID=1940300 RepID=A0A8K0UK91_9AGAR|nr:hypothetical protein BXZ70DRAFT_449224 [Cristinia sonorae]